MADLVVDASAMVDLLLGNESGGAVQLRLAGHRLNAPAHLDAEILSALGRLHRAGDLAPDDVQAKLILLASAPIVRHPIDTLILGAWARRHRLRLVDALYIQLAATLDVPVLTTDRRLRDEPLVEVVDS